MYAYSYAHYLHSMAITFLIRQFKLYDTLKYVYINIYIVDSIAHKCTQNLRFSKAPRLHRHHRHHHQHHQHLQHHHHHHDHDHDHHQQQLHLEAHWDYGQSWGSAMIREIDFHQVDDKAKHTKLVHLFAFKRTILGGGASHLVTRLYQQFYTHTYTLYIQYIYTYINGIWDIHWICSYIYICIYNAYKQYYGVQCIHTIHIIFRKGFKCSQMLPSCQGTADGNVLGQSWCCAKARGALCRSDLATTSLRPSPGNHCIGGQILRTSFGKKISRAREDVLSLHLENYILRTLNKHILRTFQG